MTGAFIKGKRGHRQTLRENTIQRQRQARTEASRRQEVTKTAGKPLKIKVKKHGEIHSHSLRRGPTHRMPSSQTSGLQDCETIHFCDLRPQLAGRPSKLTHGG